MVQCEQIFPELFELWIQSSGSSSPNWSWIRTRTIEDRVTLALREMLMRGEFVPGQKLVEAVSRSGSVCRACRCGALFRCWCATASSPICRTAVPSSPASRLRQVNDARELRGSLEGLAARLVVERGLAPATRRALEEMLEEGDRLFRRRHDLAERGGGLSAAQLPFSHRRSSRRRKAGR